MKIDLPNIEEQRRIIFEESTKESMRILKDNLQVPVLPKQDEINESDYSSAHRLLESQGWEAPHADIVGAYFRHFQTHFPEYNTDKKLAGLLGLSSDRRIREFKQGSRKVPYDVWRHFLVITGREPQSVVRVFAYMD